MTPGDYTVRITLLDNSGLEHAKQDRTLFVRAAAFELTQVPPYRTFNSGQEASFTFKVKNTGNQEGAAELNLKAYDLIDSTRLEWLKPGEEKEISFSFLLPSDLEEKDYFADYELKGQGPGFKGQVKYHLAGINIGVNASLDKQDYVVNDTARLTLQLTDGRAQTSDVSLFARVNYNGYEEQRQFTLNGSQMLTFDVPLAQITGEKLFYGIYHETGRSVHLNSLYIYEAGQTLTISTDKQVYESGETIAVSIQGQGAGGQGTMTLVGPDGYSETFAFNGSASKSIALPPMMTGGTYMINAQLQTSISERVTASHPIDVNGIQVKIIEANLDKGKYAGTDTIMANLTITSNADLAATLKTWLVDPQGKKTAAGEQPIALTASAPLLVTHKAQLSTTISGIHRLVYYVYSGDMLFSAGAEVFDVGDAVLLSIVSDKVEYSTNTKPAMAGLNMYGTVNANLELQLDGQTISSTIVALQGFVTLSLPLETVTAGSHVLTGVLTTGNLTSTKETSFIVRQMDITPPTTAIFIGAPKYETSSMTFVTNISQFTLSASDDSAVIIKTEYRIDGGTWTSYVPFTISTAGNHTIEYRSLDNAGNLETAKSLTVMVDTISPAGTVSINGGALSTNTASVQLTLSCNDASSGCAQMMFSSDNSAWTTPEAYGTAKTWQLPLGDELKTVYVRFTDVVGNQSSAYNANITLDTTPPTTTAAPASGIYNEVKGIVLTSSELGTIYYTTDGTTPTTASTVYGGPITVSGNTALKFLAMDIAGNSETPVKSAIYTIDSIPPFLTLSMLPDGALTNNATLNIAGTATDNIGLQGVMISNTTVTVNADGTFSQALKLVNGSNTITTVATDVAGNTTTDVRTIILDQSAPVITIIHPPDNSITNEVTTTVTGTVDKMSTVSIKINNTSLVPVSVTDSTFSYPVGYDYGQNTIEVTATDFAGNIGTAKRTVTFDNLSPALAITNPAQDITTKQANILLQGTVADLTITEVTITCDGITYTPTVAAGLFEQQLTFTEENTYTAIVTATDAAGNTSTVQRNIIYDKTPPILTINPVKTPTNTSQQMVAGTMELNSTVTVTCATSVVGVVSYPTDTTWQVVIADMTEGTNLITVTATDQTGNVSNPASATIVLDTQAPDTVIQIGPATLTNQNSANFSFISTEESSTFECSLDQGNFAPCGNPIYFTTLAEGVHVFQVRAHDAPGTVDPTPAIYLWTVDTIPPVAVITKTPTSPTRNTDAVLGLAGDDVIAYKYRLDNGISSAEILVATPITLVGLTDGAHLLFALGKDLAGNWQKEEHATIITWTVDTQAPVLTLSTLPDGALTNNATLNIAGTATDNIGLQGVMISNTTVTVNADGTFSQALKLVNGSNTITTVATDVAGNTTTDVRTIILDQSAPVITIIHPPDNSITNEVTTTVTGTVDKMSTVSIKINNTSLVPVSVTDSTFSYPVGYDYGQNTIEVTATDFAGNIGTAKRTVTFDNLSPALAITNPAQDITTKQANILLQGTVADLTITEVTITCDGITYTPTVATGLFEQQLTFTEENTYTAIVTATDAAGNTSTVQRNIIYDKTPPILTINPVKTPTNTSQQMVTGTMELNSTVTVTCATSVVGVVSYPTDTTWQVVIADMTEGTNLITVTATDQTGNVSNPVSAAILLDIHAPITTPNPAAGTYNSALLVTLTANEPVTIYYTTDGSTPTTDSTVYIGAIVIVSTSTVKLFAIDTAGNREAVKSAAYTIMSDITPPTTIITTGKPQYAAGGGKFYVTSATAFTLSATDDLSGVAKTEYRLDNGSWTTFVSPIMLATEGSHTIGYRSTDNAANLEIEKNLGVVVDNTPTVSTISLGAPPVTVSTEISITVADSASGVRLTEYAVDGGSWTTYNGGFTLAGYSQGTYIINYRSTDNVTNVEKTKSQSMQLWTERPTITTPSLADGTTGATYSQTLAASGAPPYTWLLAAGTLPAGLVLNGTTGTISGTPTYAGTSSMTLQVMDIHGMTNTKDLSITIYNSLTITTSALPAGVTGTVYSQTLTATGGKAPSTWSISAGVLPTGLTMNSSTGVISGTPTSAGTSTFTAQVTDSGNRTNAKIFAIAISNALSITTTSLPSGSTCSTYSQTLTASGGKTPYTWSVTAGSLPAGLSLNSSTGVMSGTPKTTGTSNFTVQVKDAINVTIAKTLSITISGPLTISTVSLPTGTIGTTYSQTVTATGGKTPYTWSIKAGSLPAGLSLAGSTGLISGAPTTAGTSNFTVQVKDAINATSAKSLSITIYAPLTISTSSLPGGTIGAAYSQTLAATGGKTPLTWSMASGSLPAGLSLTGSTGVISGTPTTTGTSTFSVQVKDANNTTSTKTLSIIIYAPLAVGTSSLSAGTKGTAYSQTLTATGGKTPYTWSISSGSLPAGLTLTSTTGVISGTPTKKGRSYFTVKVTDANANTATKSFSITVN